MTSESDIDALARELVEKAAEKGRMLATVESCTGGLIAAAITSVAGSSAVFDRGLVTYSNAAKQEMAGVRSETLERHGAVSAETAGEMAQGALDRSLADVALSVTGIAGPGGGSLEKPVGLVFIGVAAKDAPTNIAEFRFGAIGREAVRRKTVREGLKALITAVG